MSVLSGLMDLLWASQGIRERTRGYGNDELIHLEWMFKRPVPDAYGYAYFEDDVCTAISILTYGPLTVADAFGRFGEPDLMWMHSEKVGAREWVEVTLVYSAVGIVVEVDVDLPAGGQSVGQGSWQEPGLACHLFRSEAISGPARY